ncbi:MAG: acylneuraminate cytidylyltransferase family protein [Deltaproteobacteria bacterium]|nr:acylneuraminate cytidylyltransferase family protein [Deltaproteobacteria bacterium]MBW2342554.1 acylneuraminate cytidylyltransferase family protein [Deltaproteobacteria bacterium]
MKDRSKIKVLAIIPARGGSKRLPRKNIREICGRPLLAYTIKAARNAERITHFLVSSEDNEIIEVARKYNAPVPFVRPAELSGDKVRNIDVVDHALRFMEGAKGVTYDIIVLLQPTSPVRDHGHIDSAVELLWNSDCDSLASVKGPFKKRDPILKAIRNGILEDYSPVKDLKNVEPFYLYNASLYAVKRDYFVRHKKLISPKQIPLIMDKFHSVDVDTDADFLVAESYINYMKNQNKDNSL